jgi:hypothetical protein
MLTHADVCADTRSDANTQYHATAAAQLCELEQIVVHRNYSSSIYDYDCISSVLILKRRAVCISARYPRKTPDTDSRATRRSPGACFGDCRVDRVADRVWFVCRGARTGIAAASAALAAAAAWASHRASGDVGAAC